MPDVSYSPPDPNADRPPRLAVCINTYEMMPERSVGSGDGSCQLGPGEQISARVIRQVLKDICDGLETDSLWGGLSSDETSIWATPGGVHPQQDDVAADPALADEEQWAKLMDELFLGSAYGGPDITAEFPKEAKLGTAIQYIYERLQWPPPAKPGEEPHADPAYSLVVACQHLTTYGAICRGLTVPEDLYGGGIPASQAAAALPVFHPETGSGTWHSSQGVRIMLLDVELDYANLTAAQAHSAETVTSEVAGYGPGTIYAYNPVGHKKFVVADVPVTDLIWKDGAPWVDSDGLATIEPRAGVRFQLQADGQTKDLNQLKRSIAAGANAALSKHSIPLRLEPVDESPKDRLEANAAAQSTWTSILSGVGVVKRARVPLNAQLTGSHVSMVLRTFKIAETPLVQLLDTSAFTPGAAAKDYVMFQRVAGGRGIFAGEASSSVPGNRASFVGLGVLPALKDWSSIADWLCRARPVGLARLVLAARKPQPTEDDVYFVSRMIPTWGYASPRQNFSLARLLFSLRNTPYYKSIQAYWVVYAPRGALAVAMWEPGAREYSLAGLSAYAITKDNEWREARSGANAKMRDRVVTSIDMIPVAVLSHDDSGRAIQLWRNHATNGGGEGSPPTVIKKLFISTRLPPLDAITKKRDQLKNAFLQEVAARKQRNKELDALLIAAAARGDQVAVNKHRQAIKALWAKPFPERAEYFDFIEAPLDEKHRSPLTLVREEPFASYVSPAVPDWSADLVPELLT